MRIAHPGAECRNHNAYSMALLPFLLPHGIITTAPTRKGHIMNRWYDKDPRLPKLFDILRQAHPRDTCAIVNKLLEIIKGRDPEILARFEVPDDVEQWSRRWYDQEPVLWLALNGLKHADGELLEKVTVFLETELGKIGRP